MLVLGAAILFPSALRPRTGPSSTPASEPDWLGNPPYAVWQRSKPGVRLASFADAGADGEVVLNATSGSASLAALDAVGVGSLAGKVLVDVARPLDMSEGMRRCCRWRTPDSLGEQIQRALPDARVVKTLTRCSRTCPPEAATCSNPRSRRSVDAATHRPFVGERVIHHP